MDNSLRALCDAIKKTLAQLKPQYNPLSFIIITGKDKQGKSSLLKQSQMGEVPVLSEDHAKIYFNQHGIILELGESWLSNNKNLLQNTLKQLNKCNRYIKITGFILCVDANDLLISEPLQFSEQKSAHLQILERIGINLGYKIELALMFTQMDTLAGFSEFYQTEHQADLSKPLGFSLDCLNQKSKKVEVFNQQFQQLIEGLGQQVINKMHPARSTSKRSLIREFPLQLASLRVPIQAFVQAVSTQWFNLNSIYFTSAEQGGMSVDRLNKKIQHEYALMVQDSFPQATNFRSFFITGALQVIQNQCTQMPQGKNVSQKPIIALALGVAGLCLTLLFYSHHKTSLLLDDASKELLTFDALNSQGSNNTQALYHLNNAVNHINKITSNSISLPTVHQLKYNLHHHAQTRIKGEFLPGLMTELEQAITNPSNTPFVRYKALKIYLMLGQPEHFSAPEVVNWFEQHWHDQADKPNYAKQMTLLKQTLNKPLHSIPIKDQVISDARNYLNALPSSYFYYSLAKESFPTTTYKIEVEGFHLSSNEVPIYFTKKGFEQTLKELPNICNQLQNENWVLSRQDLGQLQDMLLQAYSFDYVTWWQTFMKKTQPLRYQDYQQGRQVVKLLQKSNAISQLVNLVQQETKPDLTQTSSPFNQLIATRFTDQSLISSSSIKEVYSRINELDQFISTLSVINDGGKTAFAMTKARFLTDQAVDPISVLNAQARQMPEPLNNWIKQLAGDSWVILIRDSRHFINNQWQETVYKEFQYSIANRYPFDSAKTEEITVTDFNRFFAAHGVLNNFIDQFVKPFIDVSSAEWKPKAVNDFVMPISSESLDQLIRANIITNMFFPDNTDISKIEFSLQKINLDPVVSRLHLKIGATELTDNQNSESFTHFTWPQKDAQLALDSIEGKHYEIAEHGFWALFKLLEKVNVLVDEQDSSNLQILFEINSTSGRYQLKTNNKINPFTPGILNGFTLHEAIV